MKQILLLLCLLPSLVLAQSITPAGRKLETKVNGKFSQRSYRIQDSTAVNVTLPRKATRPDYVFVSRTNPDADFVDLPAAYNALPAQGGTILLDNIRPGQSPYTGNITISKPNVSIIGLVTPMLNPDTDTLVTPCARILGKVLVQANGFSTNKVAYLTTTIEDDCLALQPINFITNGTDATNHLNGAQITNCVFVGKARTSLFHGLRIEGYRDVIIENIATVNNVHGVALKSNNISLKGLIAKNHDFDGLIIKADLDKTVENIVCTNVSVTSTSTTSGTYTGCPIFIQNFANTSALKNVVLSNVTLKNGWIQFSNPTTNSTGLTQIQINNAVIDNSGANMYSLYFTGSGTVNLGKIAINNVTIRTLLNTPVYDGAKLFSNVTFSNLASNRGLDANLIGQNRSLGTQFQKTGVASGAVTNMLDIAYDVLSSEYFGSFLCTVSIKGTNFFGSATYMVTVGYNTATATQLGASTGNSAGGSTLSAITLGATSTTASQKITLTASHTNSNANNATIFLTVVPLSTLNEVRFTPL